MADDQHRRDVPSESRPGDIEELLSDPHVRYLLQYVHETDEPVELQTLATHVAAGITDTPPEDVPDTVRNRVQTFLHHGQIPELVRHELVEFDRESNLVSDTR
jgi:hypothetical protein